MQAGKAFSICIGESVFIEARLMHRSRFKPGPEQFHLYKFPRRYYNRVERAGSKNPAGRGL
jgi:hypothetical protein